MASVQLKNVTKKYPISLRNAFIVDIQFRKLLHKVEQMNEFALLMVKVSI